MKQQHVTDAIRSTGGAGARCDLAKLVHGFLTRLIDGGGANWLERQVLRSVRGYVTGWMVSHGCGESYKSPAPDRDAAIPEIAE